MNACLLPQKRQPSVVHHCLIIVWLMDWYAPLWCFKLCWWMPFCSLMLTASIVFHKMWISRSRCQTISLMTCHLENAVHSECLPSVLIAGAVQWSNLGLRCLMVHNGDIVMTLQYLFELNNALQSQENIEAGKYSLSWKQCFGTWHCRPSLTCKKTA